MNKNTNKGCFSSILGTLCVVLGVVLYALLSSQISKILVRTRFGADSACAILTLTVVGYAVAFVLYEVVFVLRQVQLSQKAAGRDDEGGKLARLFRIAAVGAVCLSLLFSIVVANTFVALREDSISKVCFVETKSYRWDDRCDVLRYNFACDESGALTCSVIMKDGEQIDVLGGVTTVSDAFAEQFDTSKVSLLSYAAYLSEQFDESEFIIEKKISGIEHMEAFYKQDHPEIWEQLERIIASVTPSAS